MWETLISWGNGIWEWFGVEDHQNRAQAIAAVVAVFLTVVGAVVGVLWYLLKRVLKGPVKQLEPAPQPALLTGDLLSMDQHLDLLEKREERLKAQLASAHDEEKAQLSAQITELQSQIDNPEDSLAKARERIADLEILLTRAGNDISAERLTDARSALEQGDFSKADALFAEIEAREEIAIQNAARAAYGRGEIAEAEIRWNDAYAHYKRAANISDDFEHIQAYARMCWRLAKGDESIMVQRRLVEFSKLDHGKHSPDYATQLNNYALLIKSQGRFNEAEELLREALKIDTETKGPLPASYANHLNNLAEVVRAQGRYKEAEGLFRDVLKLDVATIGNTHPEYATHLNNLAGALEAQGRYDEAERLFRQALAVDARTIGIAHPDYAIDLNNLANVVAAQGRYEEAEGHFYEALETLQAALPHHHPHIAIVKESLASLPD